MSRLSACCVILKALLQPWQVLQLTWFDVQATAKEYGTAYGREEEVEDAEDDIRLETAADREARRLADAYSNSDNIPAPQVDLPLTLPL